MKNTTKFISVLVVIFAGSFLQSCENPLADFQLSFKDPIQEGLYQVRLRDYANVTPANVEIELLGADKDKIVNTLNAPKFKINEDGNIAFAISPDVTPTATNPIEYTISLKAAGYTPIFQPVRFTSKGNQSKTLTVAALSENPSEISATVATYKSAALSVEKTLSNGVKAVTTINEGTTFTTNENVPLSGDVNLTLHTIGNGRKYFLPGGGLVANALTPDLEKIDEAFNLKQIIQYTYFQVADANGNIAHNLSKPINQRISIPADVQNPDAKRRVQTGDELTVVSYNEFTNRWIKEKPVAVQNGGAGLFIDLPITHLSYWAVGWTQPLCSFGPKYVISSEFSDIDIDYLAQIKDVNTGAVLRQFYLSVNNNRSYNFNYFPFENNTYRLELLDFSNFRGGDRKVIATTGTTTDCVVETQVVDAKGLKLPEPIQVKFEVNCPAGQKLDESLLPLEMRTQISEPGKNSWRDLLTFTRKTRDIKTYRLTPKSTYDFRISTDGGASWPYKQTNYTIDEASWSIKIDAANYCK